jgi:hypothetical protein
MLRVIYAEGHLCRGSSMLIGIYKHFMLSFIKMNVVMLSVVAPTFRT